MSGRSDVLFAFFAAASVHIGILAVSPSGSGGGGGQAGSDRISISVAAPAISMMVQDWDRPPEVQEVIAFKKITADSGEPVFSVTVETSPDRVSQPERTPTVTPPRITAPVLTAAPVQSTPALRETPPTIEIESPRERLRLATPSLESAPEHGTLPAIEITTPPIDIAPRLAERPAPRPLEPARQEAVTRQIAAGTANGSNRGSSQALAPRASDTARQSATAAWAAAIQKSIAHHHIYPRGTNDEGRVRVAMVVLPNGSLASVSVARSSGSAALDKAAVIAVKRAAPFPPAPKGLDDQWYDIGQWISFERR